MKKIITNIIVSLLIIAAVCGGLAWLLPVRVSITLIFILQVLTLVIIGSMLKREKHEQKEQ
jgi:membrane protein implicated in regulation of membrane protease activity